MLPLLWCLAVALHQGMASHAQPAVRVDSNRAVLENALVKRVLQERDGLWVTVSVARADGSDELALESEEVRVRLMDGREIRGQDLRPTEPPTWGNDPGLAWLQVSYAPRSPALAEAVPALTITYYLANEPYLRKSVVVHMREGTAVDRLEVERFRTGAVCDRGGYGEPVFIGTAWFAGLEYPGSETRQRDGEVTLAHFPGLGNPDPEGGGRIIQSKTAVIGTGQPQDPLELAFSDYVDTIRRPRRSFLQYNSWYDWRGDELSLENLIATYEAFRRHLLEPYGLRMEAFVPDDGWQDGNSIWVPRQNLYPEGFGSLREALESRGTRLGIWMPLNGTNLNTEWGVQQGYERSDQGGFYCLVGPRYNAAIREATRRLITEGNLAYYKHDFNTLRCTADGHGHLPDDRHGHEANLDAELELLAYERALQPDIFLNITSNVWLSPWWLPHADSVWMCAGDFGYDKTWPQLSPREWDMSYRDVHFFIVYHTWRSLVPVSAMMTHGVIHGRYAQLGGEQETLREFADMVAMYYGRGVQLKELYVTPDLMDAGRWQALGETTRWAVDKSAVLDQVVMVGGDPRRGEIHGYAHWLGDQGILCLRNPDVQEQVARVPFDKSVRYRGPAGREFRGRVVYPFTEDLPTQFRSGTPCEITVPGCSVLIVELTPGQAPAVEPARPLALVGATAQAYLEAAGNGSLTATVPVPDEAMQRCDLYLIVRGAGRGLQFETLTVEGAPAQPRRADGPGWALYSLDLRGARGTTVQVRGTLPGGRQLPFSSPDVVLSAWLVADRPVMAQPTVEEHLPFQASAGYRRQTVRLMPDTKLSRARQQRSITAEDLKTITAAKLRIRVFDVNSEPPYQGKFIFLNGEKLAPVPTNQGELSAWQETVLDLQPDQLGLVQMDNTLELDNAGGDCYKFTSLTLAVQLADGTWVESSTDETVHSSVSAWAYTEGEVFPGQRSGPIRIRFGE